MDTSDGSASLVVIVKNTIQLDGISPSSFNNDIKIIRSFVETVATMLQVQENQVKNVRACRMDSTEENCPGTKRRRRSLLEDDKCIIRYEVEAKSQEDANGVEQKMKGQEYQTSKSFTVSVQEQFIKLFLFLFFLDL